MKLRRPPTAPAPASSRAAFQTSPPHATTANLLPHKLAYPHTPPLLRATHRAAPPQNSAPRLAATALEGHDHPWATLP